MRFDTEAGIKSNFIDRHRIFCERIAINRLIAFADVSENIRKVDRFRKTRHHTIKKGELLVFIGSELSKKMGITDSKAVIGTVIIPMLAFYAIEIVRRVSFKQ